MFLELKWASPGSIELIKKKKCSNIKLSPVSLDKHTVVDHHRDLYLRLYVLPFYKKRSSFRPSVSQQSVAVSNQDCDVTPYKPKPDFKHTLISCGSGVLSISK